MLKTVRLALRAVRNGLSPSEELLLVQSKIWLDLFVERFRVDPSGTVINVSWESDDGSETPISELKLSDTLKQLDEAVKTRARLG